MPAKNLSPVRKKLLRWYDDHKRDLPWRRSRDPYAIWLAETMLQQTQVKTVLPYYEKFLAAFPSIDGLARAPLQRVLRLWSGLGYYRRAENLKKAAGQIVRDHDGKLPDDYDKLRALAGIGDYTAGAVLSIAFGKQYPAIDGNVRRVFSRLHSLTDEKQVRALVARLISPTRPGDFNQALMELGATICTPKNPRCAVCPVERECAARRHPAAEARKWRRPQTKVRDVSWPLAIVRRGGKILLRRRGRSGLLASLWELPGLELARGQRLEHFRAHLRNDLPFVLTPPRRIGAIRHSITHRRIQAPIYLFDEVSKGSCAPPRTGWRWLSPAAAHKQPISSMTAKAIRIFADYEENIS